MEPQPHPGLDIFKLDEALSYFNYGKIVRDEIDDAESYLDIGNIILISEKIYYSRRQKSTSRDVEESPPAKLPRIESLRPILTTEEYTLDDEVESPSSSLHCNNISPEWENLNNQSSDTNNSPEQAKLDNDDVVNLRPLFWLMSVLPPIDISDVKRVLDRDKFRWKISVSDVLMVFLNWGASLERFGLEESFPGLLEKTLDPPFRLNKRLPMGEIDFQSDCSVRNVLASVTERLPAPSAMSLSDRILLVKLLLYASLDKEQRDNVMVYLRALRRVLLSFNPWDLDTAKVLAKGLGLGQMGNKNAVYTCCCVFNMTDDRLSLVGLAACLHMLELKFGLPSESLSSVVADLTSTPNILERYTMEELYTVTQLLNSVLDRIASDKTMCPKVDVEKLYHWTVKTRNDLKQPDNMFNEAATITRERLSRLTSACNNILLRLYNQMSVNQLFSNPLQ